VKAVTPRVGWRIIRAFRHAFLSSGFRLFGPRFSRDYLRFVWHAGRHWGDTSAGVLKMLGYRIEYFNQSHALFLVHEIFSDGTYAFASRTACPRIIDCGANIGLSVIFFKALHPGADIVAVEPDPVTFARLKDTMDRNGLHDVRLVNAAVAEAEKTMTLYRGEGDAGSIVSSWIRPGGPHWGIRSGHSALHHDSGPGRSPEARRRGGGVRRDSRAGRDRSDRART
jgi:hypothetical protein